jgi:hypothetical protein
MDVNDFERWFSRSTRRFERALLKLGAALLLLLFLAQYLLSHDTLRGLLNYMVRLEGPRAEEVFAPDASRRQDLLLDLELALEGGPADLVTVLVNQGEKFFFRDGRLALKVKEGDLIEIDSRSPEPVTVRVIAAGPRIRQPLVGHSVTAFGTNELLGWVRLE